MPMDLAFRGIAIGFPGGNFVGQFFLILDSSIKALATQDAQCHETGFLFPVQFGSPMS